MRKQLAPTMTSLARYTVAVLLLGASFAGRGSAALSPPPIQERKVSPNLPTAFTRLKTDTLHSIVWDTWSAGISDAGSTPRSAKELLSDFRTTMKERPTVDQVNGQRANWDLLHKHKSEIEKLLESLGMIGGQDAPCHVLHIGKVDQGWIDASAVSAVASTKPTTKPKPARKETTPKRSTRPQLTKERPGFGEIGYTNDGPVFMATSEAAYDRLMKLAAAGDKEGVNGLVLGGLIYTVPKYTKCRLIDVHGLLFQSYEVRVLDGKHRGKLGFTSGEFLSKAR